MATKKTIAETVSLIDSFAEFNETKNIDRATLVGVLEECFRSVIAKLYGSDENYDVIVNPAKGDFEIYRNRTVVADGEVKALGLPASNVVELSLSGAGRVIVRPSGTEPKVKFYFTAVAPERESAEARLGELAEEMKQFVPAD